MIAIDYRPAHQARINELIQEVGRTDDRFMASARKMLIAGNERDRMQGVDRTGRRLTSHKKRKGIYAGATGPTLAPFRKGSRSIATFFVDRRPGTLVAGFRGLRVEILAYHAAGKAGRSKIVRDVMGVSPRTLDAIRDEWRGTIRARFARGVRGVRGAAASLFG
jgi:hypothetical protein